MTDVAGRGRRGRTPTYCCPSRCARSRAGWPARSAAPAFGLGSGGADRRPDRDVRLLRGRGARRRPALGPRGADVRSPRCTRSCCSRRRCSRPTSSATSSTGGWASLYGANPYLRGPARDRARSAVSVHRREVGRTRRPSTARVFTALSYRARAALDRRQRARVQGDRGVRRASRRSRSSGTRRGCAGIDPVKAVALVGLNPLIVVYGVGGGHNDLLMLLASDGGRLPAAARTASARAAR